MAGNRHKRASGGRLAYTGKGSKVEDEANEKNTGGAVAKKAGGAVAKKSGGAVPGRASGGRCDKRARGGAVGFKSGGGVGADHNPFSSAGAGYSRSGPASRKGKP